MIFKIIISEFNIARGIHMIKKTIQYWLEEEQKKRTQYISLTKD